MIHLSLLMGNGLLLPVTYEGHPEVYVMPSEGGEAQRLTYISEGSQVVGWTDDDEVIFSSTKNNPFRLRIFYKVDH